MEKRIKIGNKWAEIIKQMPGRTENNVKNRYNMMYKNIKNELLKNRNHDNIHDIEGAAKEIDDDILDENELIKQLIDRKKKQL